MLIFCLLNNKMSNYLNYGFKFVLCKFVCQINSSHCSGLVFHNSQYSFILLHPCAFMKLLIFQDFRVIMSLVQYECCI